jgi:hypothetical protein
MWIMSGSPEQYSKSGRHAKLSDAPDLFSRGSGSFSLSAGHSPSSDLLHDPLATYNLCTWSWVLTQLQSRPTCVILYFSVLLHRSISFAAAVLKALLLCTTRQTINTATERNDRPSTASPPPPCGSASVAETRHRFTVDTRHALWELQWKTNSIMIIRLIICETISPQWAKVKIKSGTWYGHSVLSPVSPVLLHLRDKWSKSFVPVYRICCFRQAWKSGYVT